MNTLKLDVAIKAGKNGVSAVKVSESAQPLHWTIDAPPEEKKRIDAWMKTYASGTPPTVELTFDLQALSNFTQWVLLSLNDIPFGQTISYGELARRVGSPRAARAVGSGCGRNPVPLLLPCHRVIASGGGIGGFGLGLDIKRQLLAFEGAWTR